ncbi:putative E3 ubiquitin-protein ligase XBAT31 [Cannabis sativa]|uniref:RING-type E3 ubiquitin transferase n=1 Tax=Cannabis sativa TaxID=3483 RepID=A0A803QHN3_CANSA|nr:putative E3 ubiquitin-protein ligase XBAT31 [Cannabis sativa]
MGQGLSCRERRENALFGAIRDGELELVEALAEADRSSLAQTKGRGKLSPLHVAAANGRFEVLSMILDRCGNPDILNRQRQTPLMLATMHGKIACVQRLIEAGANILMFDSVNGRTCLHYASYYGHSDCLKAILSAARSDPVANSWGFARFVNIRDAGGATPLHLAARQRRSECVHVLLDHGALVCASTGGYSYPGSTPLHLAARGGSLECVRELLAWGANRLQLDSSGRIPFTVALKNKNRACAALLNPSAAEPLVWPSPLKFISELNPDAKALLERALMEANLEREKAILKEAVSESSPLNPDIEIDDNVSEASEVELCCICFDQLCTIEIRPCGHQMCAHCLLALCCHKKPHLMATCAAAPLCPFCRSSISQLVVANINTNNEREVESSPSKPRRSRKSNFSEGSSSFKSLSAMGSFGRMGGRNSGKVAAESSEDVDKP